VAVIARSFARIHRRNLIAQGILPLTFVDPADRDRLSVGVLVELPDIREVLRRGDRSTQLIARGDDLEIPVATGFTTREREVLLAGGLLAHIRGGGGTFGIHRGHSAAVDQGSPITSPVEEEIC
jgi:aconitate hydratase